MQDQLQLRDDNVAGGDVLCCADLLVCTNGPPMMLKLVNYKLSHCSPGKSLIIKDITMRFAFKFNTDSIFWGHYFHMACCLC